MVTAVNISITIVRSSFARDTPIRKVAFKHGPFNVDISARYMKFVVFEESLVDALSMDEEGPTPVALRALPLA